MRMFLAAALIAIADTARAQAGIIGGDAAACTANEGPAIQANIIGLKDRGGDLKLELYPATQADFLKDDRDLIAAGKFFRRVRVATPQTGSIAMCIRAPHAGSFALLFTHDRDGKNKFSIWDDGAGFPDNARIGRSRPKLAQALIAVGSGVTVTNIRVQYLRGMSGFGPLTPDNGDPGK